MNKEFEIKLNSGYLFDNASVKRKNNHPDLRGKFNVDTLDIIEVSGWLTQINNKGTSIDYYSLAFKLETPESTQSNYDELDINSGYLIRNENKINDNQPDFMGETNINGVLYNIAAWQKISKSKNNTFFLSVSIREKANYKKKQAKLNNYILKKLEENNLFSSDEYENDENQIKNNDVYHYDERDDNVFDNKEKDDKQKENHQVENNHLKNKALSIFTQKTVKPIHQENNKQENNNKQDVSNDIDEEINSLLAFFDEDGN